MDEMIFLILLAVLAFLLGPVGFFLARSARRDIRGLEAALALSNRRIAALEAAGVAGSAPYAQPAAPEEIADDTASDVAPDESPPAEPQAEPARQRRPGWMAGVTGLTPASAAPEPARPRRSLEEALGTRWTVWVGGVALALGAVLLVRYSIEQGVFGPGVRVSFGALLALALAASGEWLRRRDPESLAVAGLRQPHIPGVLTAAGTVAAFATLWAAHALYGFIGPGPALVLMGATGIAAMFAAALHGPALAGLGLVGAFMTPALVSSDDPSPWPLVLYLAVIAGSAYGLARLRHWLWLAMASATGATLWGVMLAGSTPGAETAGVLAAAALVHLVLQTALGLAFVAWEPNRHVAIEDARLDKASHVVGVLFAALSLVTFGAVLAAGQYGTFWQICALATVGLMVGCAVRVAPAAGVAVMGALVALLALWFWPPEFAPPLVLSGEEIFTNRTQPRDPTTFALFALLATGGAAAACGWRLFTASALRLPLAAIYAAVAGLAPLAALGLVFLRFTRGESSAVMAAVAAVLAMAFVYAARIFLASPRVADSSSVRLGLGAMASAAISALALGCVFILEGGTLTVALALAALGTAFVSQRFDIPALRWCVCGFGLLVSARYAWDPRIVGASLGKTPIFNWLLFGYGIPAAAFAMAARIMARRAEDAPVRVADGCAVLFAALLVFFEIRHGVNGGNAFARGSGLVEQGLMATSSFAFSVVLMSFDARRANVIFRYASMAAAALGIGVAIVGLALLQNPFFTGKAIEGGPVFNGLILGYVLPGIAAFVLARRARALGRRWIARATGIATIGFLFLYATLEVRRLFHDERIGWLRSTSDAESWAYSAVWLVLGIFLLAYGLVRQSLEARIASAIFIVVTVLKVFLLDLAGLDGIFRALSFIGLGVVLIGIGLVYQKIVFARPMGTPEPASG